MPTPPGRLALLILIAAALGCADDKPHPFFAGQRRPFIFAHRGGGGIEPEATLPALRNARMHYPDAIVEFDVHRSKDGHLVVIHDDTVDRTTNGTGRVAEKTLAELQALDAGHCASPGKGDGTASAEECRSSLDPENFPFRGKDYRIPSLEEVLGQLPMDALLSIEVKAPGYEKQFADVMRASGRLSRLVVGAEDDEIAIRLRDLLPEVPHYLPRGAATCLALAAKVGVDYPACPTYHIFASPLSGAGLKLDTRGVLSSFQARGMMVVYWTINEESEIERLLRLGADGVFTDYPDRARRVVDALRAEGALP
jgi:glycerophosphoryl diester phosphodiesterase